MGWLFENFQILIVIGIAFAAWLKNRGEAKEEEESERQAREEMIRHLQEVEERPVKRAAPPTPQRSQHDSINHFWLLNIAPLLVVLPMSELTFFPAILGDHAPRTPQKSPLVENLLLSARGMRAFRQGVSVVQLDCTPEGVFALL